MALCRRAYRNRDHRDSQMPRSVEAFLRQSNGDRAPFLQHLRFSNLLGIITKC